MSEQIALLENIIIKKGGCLLQPSFSFNWEKLRLGVSPDLQEAEKRPFSEFFQE